MIKTTIAMCLVLASTVVGCAASSEDTTSSAASNEAVSGTLSLADARLQISAVRAKFETGQNDLLFNTSLAPAYLADIKPIFEKVAPADKLALADDALVETSTQIQMGALFDDGVMGNALAPTYQDLVSYTMMFGQLASDPNYWDKLSALIGRSQAGTLSDLQILELAGNSTQQLVAGLHALNWETAPHATAAQANALSDSDQTFGRVADLLFGQVEVVATGAQHDIAATDTFGAKLFAQTYSEIRLLNPAGDPQTILFTLANHLTEAKEDGSNVRGLALAKSALTADEYTYLVSKI